MDGEIQGRCSNAKRSLGAIHILVVDDDSTCLAVIAGMLKAYKYDVLTVKDPRDALATLRMKQGLIDLVVTDVHMPEMDGFQLQRRVYQEFNLPVIMMSADDDEDAMVKGLEGGAAFYMVKPLTANDVKNIWQHTVKGKNSKANKPNNIVVEQTKITSVNVSPFAPDKPSYEDSESISTSADELTEDGNSTRKKYKRKSLMNSEETSDDYVSKKTERKPKVVWSTSLHNRFLYAISQIGLEKSVPKKILEFMNVPGLTRENVASHLQKYRIFIRKATSMPAEVSTKSADRLLLNRPGFASNRPSSLLYDSYQQKYSKFIEQQRQKKRARQHGIGLGSKNSLFISQTHNDVIGNSQQPSIDSYKLALAPQNQIYQQSELSSSSFGLNRLNYVNPLIEDFSSGGGNFSGGSNAIMKNLGKGALDYNHQYKGLCGQTKTSSIESTGSIDVLQSDVNNLTYPNNSANYVKNQMLPSFSGDYFSTTAVQHESADLVQPQSLPPPPPAPLALQGEEDTNFSGVFDFIDTSATFDGNSVSQPVNVGVSNDIFLQGFNEQCLNPQESSEELIDTQKLSYDKFTYETDDVLTWLDTPIQSAS